MIVAVTGGTGFIGERLVARLLARGDTVRVLTRSPESFAHHPQLQPMRYDLMTAQTGELAGMLEGAEALFHCAAQLDDERLMRALHVEGTRKLVEAASHRIARWVQLSSVGVYGPVHEGFVTEEAAFDPVGEYEITKAESDTIVAERADAGGFGYSILRPSNVFGSRMSNQSLFKMIAMIDRGWFFYIGRPGASANYIHVDNVVEGLVRCATMNAARGRVYNLSDHRTIEQFAGTIAEALGRSAPRLRMLQPVAHLIGATLGRLPGFPLTLSRVAALTNRSSYPIARIQRELDYRPVISMEDGLRELVGAYRQ
ncbi:MAG TPA: NAD-dependent epimerase/dehydratase family protein [Gallionella sp.]|nr:NAD-dependent epimerase/dehydratase family protein [Gallionella sp.]